MTETDRLVVVSYSHQDAEWLRRFLVMLQPLVRNRRLEVWVDEYIEVGDEWRRDIEGAIDRAALALLLVSPDFLASPFIMEVELPALLRRGIRIVPVLVRPCLWNREPAIEALQWAHDPRIDGPLSRSADPEGMIVRVCLRIDELLPDRGADERIASTPGPAERVERLSHASQPGLLDGVPPPPPAYVEREELAVLRSTLLEGPAGLVGITGNVQTLGLHGQGGIGKSVLAAALALDPEVAQRFPDGLFWVALGESADLVAAQADLLRRLGVEEPQVRSASRGAAVLRAALAHRRCLLIVDDVWSDAAATAFHVAGPRGRVLYTTRDLEVLRAVGARTVQVDVLPEPSARELLARMAGIATDGLPAEVDRVLAATGRVALALALVGAAVGRGGRSWAEVAEELERGSETFLDHPYADTFRAMRVGVSALSEEEADLYRCLAVYPEDTPVPLQSVARLWHHRVGLSTEETREVLRTLASRDLLVVSGEEIRFHDLQRDFLLVETDDVAVLHADLLDAHRPLLPAGTSRWSALPRDEPYLWGHLVHHLRGAGERAAVLTVARDLGYLTVRMALEGVHAAESDLRQAAAVHPHDDGVQWLLRLLGQSGHLFGRLDSVADLAATVASRIDSAPAGVDLATLAPCLPAQYLVPRWGLALSTTLRRVLGGLAGPVRALAFSPDGRTLAGAGEDPVVHLWDPATGRSLATLDAGPAGSVRALAYSPNGRILASAGDDGSVRLWDPGRARPLLALDCAGAVHALAFSPDGHTLAGAGAGPGVHLWDPVSGQPLATLDDGHAGAVRALAFSPDGRILACAGQDRLVRLWDPASGRLVATLAGHASQAGALAFSPDGRILACAGQDWTVRLWDPASGRSLTTLAGHAYRVYALAFSPDGRTLASGSGDSIVCLWDPASGGCVARLEGHAGSVSALAFSPDGRILASATVDGIVHLWDPAPGRSAPTLQGHAEHLFGLAVSADGRTIASASADGVVHLWDAGSGRSLGILEGCTTLVYTLAFSPDGHSLATAGEHGVLRLWDPASGRRLVTFDGHAASVYALTFSPDGRTLASAGEDQVVHLWTPTSEHPVTTLAGHTRWVFGLAVSPDGRILASAGGDRVVRLWDPASRRPLAALEGHTGMVRALAFSPDGRILASAGDDRVVRLWDPALRRSLAVLEGHTAPIHALAFSPDGRTLASAGDDRVMRLWDRRRMEAVTRVRVGRCHTAAWAPTGLVLVLGTRLALMTLVERGGQGDGARAAAASDDADG